MYAGVMAPYEMPTGQLFDWIRDCLALCNGADARGDEQLCVEAIAELRVLFHEYLRRFPGQSFSDDLLH